MSDFDPYYEWLGIPPHERPITHYRLLGLRNGETNLKVIENAADQKMLFLRQFAAGKKGKIATRLLNEVTQARLVLLNPEKKAEYDQQFQHDEPQITRRPPAPIQGKPGEMKVDSPPAPIQSKPGEMKVDSPPAPIQNKPGEMRVITAPAPIRPAPLIPADNASIIVDDETENIGVTNIITRCREHRTKINATWIIAGIGVFIVILIFIGIVISSRSSPLAGTENDRLQQGSDADAQFKKGVNFYNGEGVAKDHTEAVHWFRLAADQGHAEAQRMLGICYAKGEGVKQDHLEAIDWFRLAANQGDVKAQYNLGIFYTKGIGVNQDIEEANHWFRLAAEQRHAEAQYNVGLSYIKGEGLAQDYTKALHWLRLAAEQGHAEAQRLLGICYAQGEGVTQDHAEAVRWYRLAADQGNAEAQRMLGVCYYRGEGIQRDHAKAVRLFRLAVDQEDILAQYFLGICYYKGEGVPQDDTEAVRCFRLAAEKGNAKAQFNLGTCYTNGEGVMQDHAEAARWYRLAANQGYSEAQCSLGICYTNGEGVLQDHAEAAHWYRLAAEQGHIGAQGNLGLYYYNGQGVPQDHAEAVRWFRLAADQGLAMAQFNLGLCYANGKGVMQDHAEAVRWYRLAAEQGHVNAQERLRKMAEKPANETGTYTNSIGMDLKLIPAGEFLIGSKLPPEEIHLRYPGGKVSYYQYEQPYHRVRITKPFYMGVHEVTVDDFKHFIAATGYETTAEKEGWSSGIIEKRTVGKVEGQNWFNPGSAPILRHPVTCVSWTDAVAFCKWLSKKEGRQYGLPTEAMWEYACRAGSDTEFSWGDSSAAGEGYLNARDLTYDLDGDPNVFPFKDGFVTTAPVGTFKANRWGLYDMHGNVAEWCSDWFQPYSSSTAIDPCGPSNGMFRLVRGGCLDNRPGRCRSAIRGFLSPNSRSYDLGFRLVLEAEESMATNGAVGESEFMPPERQAAAMAYLKGRGVTLKTDSSGSVIEINMNNFEFLDERDYLALTQFPDCMKLSLKRFKGISQKVMVSVGQMKALRSLDISFNTVGDSDLIAIMGLKELNMLSIMQTNVTSQGLRYLHGMKKLRTLFPPHSRSQVSQESVQQLQEAIPQCTVFR